MATNEYFIPSKLRETYWLVIDTIIFLNHTSFSFTMKIFNTDSYYHV